MLNQPSETELMLILSVPDLGDLERRANDEHYRVLAALSDSLYHARAAGEALIAVRAALHTQHQRFAPWLRGHFKASHSTAYAYMRIADNWEAVEAAAQTVQRAGRFGLDDALHALAEPRKASRQEIERAEAEVSELIELPDSVQVVDEEPELDDDDLSPIEVEIAAAANDALDEVLPADVDDDAAQDALMETVLDAVPGARERIENQQLRASYAKAVKTISGQLLVLDPELVAATQTPDDLASVVQFAEALRHWLDRLTEALAQPIHIVGGGNGATDIC